MIHNVSSEEQRKITGLTVGDLAMFAERPCLVQIRWGGHDDPVKAGMKIGEIYEVSYVEIHDSYAHIQFKGVVGRFNALSFTRVTPEMDVDAMKKKSIEDDKIAHKKFVEDFISTAHHWVAKIQQCNLTTEIACDECILQEYCSNIQRQLVLINARLAEYAKNNLRE